ncbi:MAG: argininosuccinate lyase [Sulfolobus sp.]
MLYRKWGSEKDFVVSYTSSAEDDKTIIEEVKLVMKAHVIELYLSGYINEIIAKKILQAINSFREYNGSYEDVHEAIEDYVIKVAGEDGGWVGLGRSRNDHVASALRLKMREYLIDVLESLYSLRKSILNKASKSTNIVIPAFTHFQPAQPTSLAHYLLYLEEELNTMWLIIFNSLKLVNRSPLGSGAVVGTNVKLDRKREAELLGFDTIITNTISATSSRVDLINAVYSLMLLTLILSRFAEDMVLLSSSFIGLLKLPDTHVSTSSLMPQKRNAVTMEVLRTKIAECFGHFSSLIVMYKSLPSGYNLDLQEMNRHYWACIPHIISSLSVVRDLIENLQVNENYTIDNSITATDAAEDLSLTGIPYRKAYMEVASKIRAGTFVGGISPKASLEKKSVLGSPNPDIISKEIKSKDEQLESQYNEFKEYVNSIISKLGELKVIEDDVLQ